MHTVRKHIWLLLNRSHTCPPLSKYYRSAGGEGTEKYYHRTSWKNVLSRIKRRGRNARRFYFQSIVTILQWTIGKAVKVDYMLPLNTMHFSLIISIRTIYSSHEIRTWSLECPRKILHIRLTRAYFIRNCFLYSWEQKFVWRHCRCYIWNHNAILRFISDGCCCGNKTRGVIMELLIAVGIFFLVFGWIASFIGLKQVKSINKKIQTQ